MRHIKFRAWDNDKKVMVSSKSQELIMISTTPGWACIDYEEVEGCCGSLSQFCWGNADIIRGRFIPMQSTGLVDMCGEDIYEGDIITSADTVTPTYRLGKPSPVEYTQSLARFTYYWGHYLSEKGVNRHHIVVIGNIYENESLL